MSTPFHAQREAYNKAAFCTAEAHRILGGIKVKGWIPHVALDRVYEQLFEAADALLDIEPNLLGIEIRETLRGMRREQ